MYGRQPKVMLTNVLKTEVGRKYIKTHLITGANLSHAVKLQSARQTSSSVDSIEIWQILSSPHQSLFISKRYVWLTQSQTLHLYLLTTEKCMSLFSMSKSSLLSCGP